MTTTHHEPQEARQARLRATTEDTIAEVLHLLRADTRLEYVSSNPDENPHNARVYFRTLPTPRVSNPNLARRHVLLNVIRGTSVYMEVYLSEGDMTRRVVLGNMELSIAKFLVPLQEFPSILNRIANARVAI